MTNVLNIHTCTVGCMDLVATIVAIPNHHLVKSTGGMVRGPRVGVPVGVDTIVVDVGSIGTLQFRDDEVLVVAMPAVTDGVSLLLCRVDT